MKRIAAIAALAFAVLAMPATAMASTSSSATTGDNSGYAGVNPGGPMRVMCPLPRGIRVKQSGQAAQITYAAGQPRIAYRKVRARRIPFRCPPPQRQAVPMVQVCAPGLVTFDVQSASGTFTEYSGPHMYPGENFDYSGTKYTVASVSGPVFTVNANGRQFVNGGVTFFDGSATAVCAGSSIGS
jgi:roadblock/LC7 domain-containing protein